MKFSLLVVIYQFSIDDFNCLNLLVVRNGEEDSEVAGEWSWHDGCEVYASENSRSSHIKHNSPSIHNLSSRQMGTHSSSSKTNENTLKKISKIWTENTNWNNLLGVEVFRLF